MSPTILNELVPEHVGKNRLNLKKLAAAEVQSDRPGGQRDSIDGLVGLYKRAGELGYEWKMFMDLRNAQWSYHSFDPIKSEQVPFDQLVFRYRKITMPKGMENWYAVDFNAAGAGWKTGKSPFGQYNGKIPTGPISKIMWQP